MCFADARLKIGFLYIEVSGYNFDKDAGVHSAKYWPWCCSSSCASRPDSEQLRSGTFLIIFEHSLRHSLCTVSSMFNLRT